MLNRGVILVLDGNVFVHGGVLPSHVAYGIDKINGEAQAWLRGEAAFPEILDGANSPEWERLYSQEPDSVACEVLGQTLEALKAKRMIMGHTVQRGAITSACDVLKPQLVRFAIVLKAGPAPPSIVDSFCSESLRALSVLA